MSRAHLPRCMTCRHWKGDHGEVHRCHAPLALAPWVWSWMRCYWVDGTTEQLVPCPGHRSRVPPGGGE